MRMVDVSRKEEVYREAEAEGFIRLRPETLRRIREGEVEKGDVFSVATLSAILAVKMTPHLLPLCHNIPITHVDVDLRAEEEGVRVRVQVRTRAQTGVEMEALVGATVALLNVWDMVKKYEKDEEGQYPHTRIEYVRVLSKVKAGGSPGGPPAPL